MKYLSELYRDEEFGKPVELIRVGTWDWYGEGLEITKEMLENMVSNFKNGLHPEPPTKLVIDYNHGSMETNPELSLAAGWVEDLFVENESLYAVPKWTDRAKEYIQNDEFGYVSVEFSEDYPSKRNGESLGATLLAFAITNRPYIEGQEKIALSDSVKEDLQKKAKARSKKYHIHVREDGHLTIPKEYEDCPEGDFADPVNYMYPCVPKDRAIAAYKYFSKEKNRSFYNKSEQTAIENRIKKHLPEEMKKTAFKGGSMDDKIKEVVELTEKVNSQAKTLAEQNDKIAKKDAEIATLKAEKEKLEKNLKLTEANEWSEKMFVDHKILPKEKDVLTKMYLDNKELAEEFINARGVIVPMGTSGEDTKEDDAENMLDDIKAIRKFAKDNNISFAKARIKMAKEEK